jgi:hypothetical protein
LEVFFLEDIYGNVTELRDAGGNPGKSSLFFLTTWLKTIFDQKNMGNALELDYPEIGHDGWKSSLASGLSGALPTALENLRERNQSIFSYLAVLITAAGLQGEQPLVDRIM